MSTGGIPEGRRAVAPYLISTGADQVIRFAMQAFGAQERLRANDDEGAVIHAEIVIGDSVIMIGEANEKWPAMPCMIHLYVSDADAVYSLALEAGGTSVQEVSDQPYGDRSGGVRDSSGNIWWIASRIA